MRVMTTASGLLPRSRSQSPQSVGIVTNAAHQDCPQSTLTALAQPTRRRPAAQHLEPAQRRRQPVTGQSKRFGDRCHNMPGAVVAYRPGTDDGAVRGRRSFPAGRTAVVGLVVTDLFTGIEDAGSTADTRSANPADQRRSFQTAVAGPLDLALETEPAHLLEIYSRSAWRPSRPR